MAIRSKSLSGGQLIQSKPKKTRQGSSSHTSYSPRPNNSRKKKYRGQGR